MHKGVFSRLAKVEIVELGDDIVVQGASLEKVYQLFVECHLCVLVAAGFLRKVDEENGLLH